MKRTVLSIGLAAVLTFSGGLALASSCPKEMKAIDAALPKATLSADKMAEVKKLRAEGEAQHKAKKHADSMASLNKAKEIRGIK
jgi:hypothetical protein